jgi:hypothetical protein
MTVESTTHPRGMLLLPMYCIRGLILNNKRPEVELKFGVVLNPSARIKEFLDEKPCVMWYSLSPPLPDRLFATDGKIPLLCVHSL